MKDEVSSRKLRILCLHGFRSSGKIQQHQLEIANWAPLIADIAELSFIDGLCPARRGAYLEEQFEGPYFEWHQYSKDFGQVYGLEKARDHFSDFISQYGPFDGLLGFSQGAVMVAAWMAYYQKGNSMAPNMSSIKFLIMIGGGRDVSVTMSPAYTDTIDGASLHLIGDECFMKPVGEALITLFKDPVVIRHPFDHVIPRLSASEGQIVRTFLLKQLQLKSASFNGNPRSLL